VALPGILRSGSVGPEELNMGTMPSPQQQITTGQMHLGHMPPLVSPLINAHVHRSSFNCPLFNLILAIGHHAV